ncbi:hypothetical protein JA33_264 [Dickeya phage vB_DsoM_JA33]|uniref:Uncharacterized protein n=3 Tax=Salmondvirus JA11 TaxID=2734141 RepID=A0A384ZWR6_9CAUD|nr:hypothetical protein HOU32_gp263 [Dickeya phage vB_DsoM_JA11]AXG66669.1 hypothetical protein JA13_266 [Dickeya phage vB_DsoM_JA13]AXG67638.1 hypothetical protein JA33_264 [Dickeya phage vB_DsoM_JA33]AYD80068.1 hypothetical protein JA11_263 [Dickeya phage vB_DsoM_JA11]
MKPLTTPVELPEYLRAAYSDMTDALSDQFEKHGLDQQEIATYLAAQLVSLLPDLGVTSLTPILHTTLPVRVGLLDAHENSVALMEKIEQLDDDSVDEYIQQLRKSNLAPEKFSCKNIARKWLRLFMATNK